MHLNLDMKLLSDSKLYSWRQNQVDLSVCNSPSCALAQFLFADHGLWSMDLAYNLSYKLRISLISKVLKNCY